MKLTTSHYLLALLASASFSMPSWASDVVIIVNKANANAVDQAFVVKVYTGEIKNWPDGGAVSAIDQNENNPIRADFNSQVLGKSLSNMKALWAQNIFTGKGLPPRVFDPDIEVKKAVSANKNAIGYVRATSVDDTVRVVK